MRNYLVVRISSPQLEVNAPQGLPAKELFIYPIAIGIKAGVTPASEILAFKFKRLFTQNWFFMFREIKYLDIVSSTFDNFNWLFFPLRNGL